MSIAPLGDPGIAGTLSDDVQTGIADQAGASTEG
jgi:hypothetical protein